MLALIALDSWACKNSHHLAVRIQGLDTNVKIEVVIAKWREGRKKKSGAGEIIFVEEYMSIEERVARFLLQFPNLKTVYLGTNTWHAKCRKNKISWTNVTSHCDFLH